MNMLMTLNLSAKFEPNRWFEYYHLLPGSAWLYHGQTLNNFSALNKYHNKFDCLIREMLMKTLTNFERAN